MAEELEEYLDVLGKPNCRRILIFLGERGSASFKELKEELGLSVGALYYSLSLLRGLVAKDKERRYHLTEKGRKALQLLELGREVLLPLDLARPYASLLKRLVASCLPLSRSIPLALTALGLGAISSALSGLTPILLMYNNRPISEPAIAAALFLCGFLLVAASVIASSTALTRSVRGSSRLLLGAAISMAPSAIFPFIWLAITTAFPSTPIWPITILMLLLTGASLALLTAFISVIKKISTEKAAFCALITFYLNVILALPMIWS
ncbi:MAG TPA: hypothetical protein ENF78_05330 [Candidatus Bathyarchaeota archaeon]|nr:hypothetical protein [Candidatus Bathyarchaeota archaeon]